MVRRRDWRALIHYGVIFFMLEKLGAVIGTTNLHIYAAHARPVARGLPEDAQRARCSTRWPALTKRKRKPKPRKTRRPSLPKS